MTRSRLVALLLVACVFGGCSDDGDDGESAVATTTSSTSTTVVASPGDVGAEDWDGTRFDVGIVDRIDRTEDGRTLVVFDREQLETEDGRKEAADFTEEPIVFGNTDQPFVNENTRLRTYVVAPTVEVLVLGNPEAVCPDDADGPAAPQWGATTIDEVVDGSLWDTYQQVSLTFDEAGLVTRIRFSTAC